MNKRTVLSVITLVFLVVAIVFGTLYISEKNKASNLKQENSKLASQNSDLQKQSVTLSGKLNEANSTINPLSTSGSFVDGATCQTQQLALSQENDKQHNPGGAAGTVGQLFSYQNISKSACTLQGYPGFLALDNKGYVVPNGPIGTGASSKSITVTPNDKAYFVVSWNHTQPAPNQKCISPSLLESTPPGALTPLVSIGNLVEICSYNLTISALGSLSDF
jgi:hypothetical protein